MPSDRIAGRRVEDGVETVDDGPPLELESKGLQQAARSRVRGVRARVDRRHFQRREPVIGDRLRDFTAEAGADVFVGDAVQQLQFGRIAKVPKRAKPDERAGRRPRQPQSEALPGKERQTLANDVVGQLS